MTAAISEAARAWIDHYRVCGTCYVEDDLVVVLCPVGAQLRALWWAEADALIVGLTDMADARDGAAIG
jgi:hypothetical protein